MLAYESLINAPSPTFTSNTIESAPDAIFAHYARCYQRDIIYCELLHLLMHIIFYLLELDLLFGPIIAIFFIIYIFINFSSDISAEKPEKDSNLSMVPPVCPSPLPDILATGIPKAAKPLSKYQSSGISNSLLCCVYQPLFHLF